MAIFYLNTHIINLYIYLSFLYRDYKSIFVSISLLKINMGIKGNSFSVKVVENVVVHANDPWNDHWLPFTNLDLLVPPLDVGSVFCYKKPSQITFPTLVNTLKASLSRALSLYYPLAGEILWNAEAGENQFHCNNRGVDFVEATADVQLKDLNLYNPDESIEGKLMPKKLHGLLAVQVTQLKCGGLVIGSMFDHRVVDGYSADMFLLAWAEITRSETLSMLPSYSFGRDIFNPRCPIKYSSSINDVFTIFEPPTKPRHDQDHGEREPMLINRVYNIEGEQLKRLQFLASENGCRRSKVVAFTSLFWKIVALSMEEPGTSNKVCNMVLPVDGRRRLSEGAGEENEKLLISHFGNVLSMSSGAIRAQELKHMCLSDIATKVHEFLQTSTCKDHFLDLIDWVEERRSLPLVAKPFASTEMAVIVSAGHTYQGMNKIDFGFGKVAFGSCHIPSSRTDCVIMTLPSPANNDDWVVYMHMPVKTINYIEAYSNNIFKPLNADYLQI
ncbi:transferase, Chloramphenicol acetyltransferase-like domain protein [Artemisia annua]|uniref:Transferase, Chloramphenicol acetyltransferase-like domain protein n=1 Tax=Artemisia annua TaxID=35608 RepID=A0A2U1Q8C7_ARTAN|nr:transferase, Chloramphenicol acetyltransferase-like domain protein [Artemisia annua]